MILFRRFQHLTWFTARASPARTQQCTKADALSRRSRAVLFSIARASPSQFPPWTKVDALLRCSSTVVSVIARPSASQLGLRPRILSLGLRPRASLSIRHASNCSALRPRNYNSDLARQKALLRLYREYYCNDIRDVLQRYCSSRRTLHRPYKLRFVRSY